MRPVRRAIWTSDEPVSVAWVLKSLMMACFCSLSTLPRDLFLSLSVAGSIAWCLRGGKGWNVRPVAYTPAVCPELVEGSCAGRACPRVGGETQRGGRCVGQGNPQPPPSYRRMPVSRNPAPDDARSPPATTPSRERCRPRYPRSMHRHQNTTTAPRIAPRRPAGIRFLLGEYPSCICNVPTQLQHEQQDESPLASPHAPSPQQHSRPAYRPAKVGRELFSPDEKISVLYLQRANAASKQKSRQFPAATPTAEIKSAPHDPLTLSLSKGGTRGRTIEGQDKTGKDADRAPTLPPHTGA